MDNQQVVITSVQNPRVKHVVKLRDRSAREESKQFLIEGYRELLRAIDARHPVDEIYVCPELFLGENETALLARAKGRGAAVYECSETVFRKISYRDRPDGILAIAPQRHYDLTDLDRLLEGVEVPFLAVAEAIEKPGNLGTILRSSDAVGLNALILCDKCTDIHNPNVVRASVGTLFTVPVIEAGSEEAIRWLKAKGISIVSATPSAVKEFTSVDLSTPIAIAVGTEQLGLSKKWMEQCDVQVKIPMCGVADSLNVAMATTLLLYESLRQRQAKSL